MAKKLPTHTRIAAQLDALIKLRGNLQTICDELDDTYDKKSDPKIGNQLCAVQTCIDYLKDAEKELYKT